MKRNHEAADQLKECATDSIPTTDTDTRKDVASSSNISHMLIGNSMKRMKISTSPGELRLNKDMENMIVLNRWIPNNQLVSTNHSLLSPDQKAVLNRDPVDTLRCSLSVMFLPDDFTSTPEAAPIVPHSHAEKWTFLLQFPRMYPHFPPKIYRITTELLATIDGSLLDCITSDTSEEIDDKTIHSDRPQDQKGLSVDTYLNKQKSCIGGIPSLQKILISSDPNVSFTTKRNMRPDHSSRPMPTDCFADGIAWEDNMTTVILRNWSPISSLEDVVKFLLQLPFQRRLKWHRHRQQKKNCQRLYNETNHKNPTMTRNVSMNQDDITMINKNDEEHDRINPNKSSDWNCQIIDQYDDNASMEKESLGSNFISASRKKHDGSFHPNRFRVGYCSHFENQNGHDSNMMVE